MNTTDQLKVLNDGFKIIRERDRVFFTPSEATFIIVCKTKDISEWHLHKNEGDITRIFTSKAARRREMKKLLLNPKIIED